MSLHQRKFKRVYAFSIGIYRITQLRMRFTCTYYLGGYIPMLEIEIYNLTNETINQMLIPGFFFFLEAGYEKDSPIIFKGQIRNVFTVRDDTDLITHILAGGLDTPLRETKINKTLDFAKSLTEVIKDYLLSALIPIGQIKIIEAPIQGSISVSDNFLGAMNGLAKAYNFEWFIHNDLFYAYDRFLFPDRQLYIISAETGLLDTPVLTERGVDVRMLMEPSIRPKDQYIVQSTGLAVTQAVLGQTKIREQVKGVQYAREIRHLGDTHSDSWYTEIIGQHFVSTQ